MFKAKEQGRQAIVVGRFPHIGERKYNVTNLPEDRKDSSGMRTIKTLSDLRSDWLMGKWSVLIGREQRSRD